MNDLRGRGGPALATRWQSMSYEFEANLLEVVRGVLGGGCQALFRKNRSQKCKIVLVIRSPLVYALGMEIHTKSVQDLSFIEVVDQVASNWSEYLVEFAYQGKEMQGTLGACPYNPELMHNDVIYDIESL